MQAPLTPLSLELLIALADGAMHGYALMKAVEEQSGGRVRAGTGTLYAALGRMMEEGLIGEAEQVADGHEDPRRKYYALTAQGRAAVRAESRRLEEVLALARSKSLGAEPEAG